MVMETMTMISHTLKNLSLDKLFEGCEILRKNGFTIEVDMYTSICSESCYMAGCMGHFPGIECRIADRGTGLYHYSVVVVENEFNISLRDNLAEMMSKAAEKWPIIIDILKDLL